jgi:hypothetical protein
MNTEGTGSHTYKECHKTESPWNHTSKAHKEREQLGDRRSDGESSCNSGDGTGQMAQPWMFMTMMIIIVIIIIQLLWFKAKIDGKSLKNEGTKESVSIKPRGQK